MGIHDREYYRDETPAGIQLGGDWSIVAKLIAINVVIFIADKFTNGHWLMNSMAASPESLAKPWMCWQLLTYAFAHDWSSYSHIFWNMFGLYIFGRDVEGVYGRKEFLRMYLVVALLGGIVFAVRGMLFVEPDRWQSYSVVGASGAVMAVTLLFCLHFPKRTVLLMMVLPVPAWALGAMYILADLARIVGSSGGVAFDVHLAGAAFAICYFRFGWRVSHWLPGARLPKFKRRPKLKLHDPKDNYEELDTEGDRLLQKVSRDGIESLTAAEKRKLEAYSRRMKQKHR